MQQYVLFCDKMKKFKIPNLSRKIENWIKLDSIAVEGADDENTLHAVNKIDFDAFIKRTSVLRRREKASLSSSTTKSFEVVDLELEKDTPDINLPSTSKLLTAAEIKKEKVDVTDIISSEQTDKTSDLNKKIELVIEKFNALRECFNATSTVADSRELFANLIPLCESMIEVICLVKCTNDSMIGSDSIKVPQHVLNNTRIISDDKTYEDNNITLMEGVLPISTFKYKKACRSFTRKLEDRKPTAVLTNIVKHCFPNHWINDVTLRGSNGRTSLISIWNHRNPLSATAKGPIIQGLGENRLKALIGKLEFIS